MSMALQSSAVRELAERAESSVWELGEVLFGAEGERQQIWGEEASTVLKATLWNCARCTGTYRSARSGQVLAVRRVGSRRASAMCLEGSEI